MRYLLIVYLIFYSASALSSSVSRAESALQKYINGAPNDEPKLRQELVETTHALMRESLDRTSRAITQGRSWDSKKVLIEMAEVVYRTRSQAFGGRDPHAVMALYDLGRVYNRMGLVSHSKRALETAFSASARVLATGDPIRADIAHLLAKLDFSNGMARSERLLNLAIKIYDEAFGANNRFTAYALTTLAEAHVFFGSPEKARDYAGRSMEILRANDITDHAEIFRAGGLLAGSYRMEVRMNDLIRLYNEGLSELATLDSYQTWWGCDGQWRQPTTAELDRDKMTECEDGIEDAIKGTENALAMAYIAHFDFDSALEHARKAGTDRGLASIRRRGDYTKAIAAWSQSSESLRTNFSFDHPRMTAFLAQGASLHAQISDYEEATNLLRNAIASAVKWSPTEVVNIAQMYEVLGTYQLELGNVTAAKAAFKTSEETYQKFEGFMPSSVDAIFNTASRGSVYLALGDFEKAEEAFRKAYSDNIEMRGDGHMQTVNAKAFMAMFYMEIGANAEAAKTFAETIALAEEHWQLDTFHPDLIKWRAFLAWFRGDLDRAIELFGDAIEGAESIFHSSNVMFAAFNQLRAEMYLDAGQYDNARAGFLKAARHESFGSPMTQLFLKSRIADCDFRMGRLKQARGALEEIYPELVELGLAGLLWPVEDMLSKLQEAEGNMASAVFFGKLAVNHIQELRTGLQAVGSNLQSAFVGDKEDVYRHLADLLIEAGDIGQTQTVVAMLKRSEYSDFLRGSAESSEVALISANAEEEKVTQRFRSVSDDLPQLNSRIRSLEQRGESISSGEKSELKKLKSQLKGARRSFGRELETIQTEFARLGMKRMLELGEKNLDSIYALQGVVKRLGQDTAFIHYLVLPDKVRILLTTHDKQFAFTAQIAFKDLNGVISEVRLALEDPGSDVIKAANELYRHIFAPLEQPLANDGITKLMVSLDGTLRYVPMVALHDGSDFLTKRYQFSVFTPAARLGIERQPAPNWRVAGFGVSEGGDDFSSLPTVKEELDYIVKEDGSDDNGVLPGSVFLDDRFTIDRFSQELSRDTDKYKVVHIASHFDFKPGRETESFLLVGNSNRLSVSDIRYGSYPFNELDLLTLSACNTGVSGIGADGSEVEGFGALAQNQGASAVLATLWQVADASTAAFMRQFYSLRSGEGMSKGAALRQTQLSFIESDEYDHPFYWSPFVLMGNWL